MAAEVRGIQDQEDRVGLPQPVHLAAQNIERYPLIFRTGRQAVDARQVHQFHIVMAFHLGLAKTMFDSHAREVRHALAQAG